MNNDLEFKEIKMNNYLEFKKIIENIPEGYKPLKGYLWFKIDGDVIYIKKLKCHISWVQEYNH